MGYQVVVAGLAATGGMVAAALSQVAVAAADISATGQDAFTIGSYTFDPFTDAGGTDVEGFAPVDPLTGAPPLLELGGGTLEGLPFASQSFEVFNPATGADLGAIQGNETITSLLGLTNAAFTVAGPASGSGTLGAGLPTTGSVYDVFNFGHGYANVYTATPSVTGTDGTVTDTLITPTGHVNLDSLFGGINAADPLNPGDAFTGLTVNGISGAPQAFGIGGLTLDPITTAASTSAVTGEGFNLITPLATTAPLLEIGGVSLGDPSDPGSAIAQQTLDVYTGSGTSATEIGSIGTNVDVINLLGLTNTELVVNTLNPAEGVAGSAALPAIGTVYDAFNLGGGYENVYTATPGADGTVTDTLITPSGNINLDSLFSSINVADPLNPAGAFTGLTDTAVAPDAFSIGTTTFDPLTTASAYSSDITGEGFNPVYQLTGLPPLLNLGGASAFGGTFNLVPQYFNIYDGTGAGATEVASIQANEEVTDLLGFTNTQLTVLSVADPLDIPSDASTAGSVTAGDAVPAVGSVYDVFNLGNGYENIYTAIPGLNGAADTITDTFVTPMGSMNLDSLFGGIDAAAPLDPGTAFDALTTAATTTDPLAFLGL